MKVIEFFKQNKPVISFEFFPPKTPKGAENLFETIGAFKKLNPSFVSMTYGAGGSTREKTVQWVSKIKHDIGMEAVAHLTCVGHTKNDLHEILTELKKTGIENIMALRGDPPKGETKFVAVKDGFRYATQLVEYIRANFDFCLGIAGYPEKHTEASSLDADLQHLKQKSDAGGDFIVTQLFFDNRDYFSFVDRVRQMGITKPIVAGIMPIKDVDQIKRFTQMCGARIPVDLLERLEKVKGDSDAVLQLGVDHATAQCEELLQKGAPGIHFYTLNKSQSTQDIFHRLKQKGLV